MADLVCDDVTNTKACFFDGGDCCLEDKETKYCTDCLCRHGGNTYRVRIIQGPSLITNLSSLSCKANNLTGFSIPDDNRTEVFKLSRNHVQNGGLYFPVLLFQLVHGPATCHKLCFEDLNDTSIANAWLFHSVTLTCQCIYMKGTDFCVEEAITEDNLHDIDVLAVYKHSAKPIFNCQGNRYYFQKCPKPHHLI